MVFDQRFQRTKDPRGKKPEKPERGLLGRSVPSQCLTSTSTGTNEEMENFFSADLPRYLNSMNDRVLFLKLVGAEGFDPGMFSGLSLSVQFNLLLCLGVSGLLLNWMMFFVSPSLLLLGCPTSLPVI